jgi:hypothetical protein
MVLRYQTLLEDNTMDTKQIQQTVFNKFSEIFKDTNHFNEKTVIGFMAFTIMFLYSAVDIVTGVMGITLEIHQFVYESFMYITLGSFGIAGLEKFSPAGAKRATEETTVSE